MARKLKNKAAEDLEDIVANSLERVGFGRDLDPAKVALLTRLIFSGVANYFFRTPDNVIQMGFLKFVKNPDKDQLFAVNIVRNEQEGIYNADTLWRYYKGELKVAEDLKKIVDEFIADLIAYSQEQEEDITELTNKLS